MVENDYRKPIDSTRSLLQDFEISLILGAINSETIRDNLTSWYVLDRSRAEQ